MKKGFTLIEVLAIVAILGVMSALIAVIWKGVIAKKKPLAYEQQRIFKYISDWACTNKAVLKKLEPSSSVKISELSESEIDTLKEIIEEAVIYSTPDKYNYIYDRTQGEYYIKLNGTECKIYYQNPDGTPVYPSS